MFLFRFVVSNAVLSKSTPNKCLPFNQVRFSYPIAERSLFNWKQDGLEEGLPIEPQAVSYWEIETMGFHISAWSLCLMPEWALRHFCENSHLLLKHSLDTRLPRWLSGKESAWHCRSQKRCRFDLWISKIPGVENGNLLQYPCLGNSMDRGAYQAIYSPWGYKESDMTERLSIHTFVG